MPFNNKANLQRIGWHTDTKADNKALHSHFARSGRLITSFGNAVIARMTPAVVANGAAWAFLQVRQWQWLIGISILSASHSINPHKQLPFMPFP
ncbi:MAG: hypothetical protein PHR16_03470 [Methylovulum sp.]|nr:hypothetical protein [Methylovulum sp.]